MGDAKVITLCGSTRFEAEFAQVDPRLTLEGCVVNSLGMFTLADLPHDDCGAEPFRYLSQETSAGTSDPTPD